MALLDVVPTLSLGKVLFLFTAYCFAWIIYCRTLHPLAKIPGPLWPAVSRTWQMYHIYLGDIELAERDLHTRYGPLVRIAPNEVSSADTAAIPVIYRTQNPLTKSDYYPTFRPIGISEQADLMTETDEEKHARYRKIVSPAYQMSSVLKNEAAIDDCTNLFIRRLEEFAARKKSIDFGNWLEMYGYDVIGHVLYGHMLGFLDTGTDVGNYIESVENALPLLNFAAVGPSYMRTPIMIVGMLVPGILKSLKAVDNITEQAKEQTRLRMQDSEEDNLKREDILSQLFRIIRERGDKIGFTHKEVTLESWVGIITGAKSVASNLSAIFYHLMKHPEALRRVAAEIKQVDNDNTLSTPVQYSEAMKYLPYMCACIKETTRIYPSFAIHMPRIAPAEGLELSGYYIPAGYRVGMNSAISQRDTGVFGPDADVFRPERWMESAERNFAMEKGMLNFGAGTRTCIGKHIATAEVHKLVPEVLRRFDVEMAHARPWRTRNAAFIKQKDIIVNFYKRQ